MDSLIRISTVFTPGAIFIQETKAQRQNAFKIENYECFEMPRNNSCGGGLLTAVNKTLNPFLVPSDTDHEILVVQASIAGKPIRFINGYSPQETMPETSRKSFFDQLDLEVRKSKLANMFICIKMDSNSKLGPRFIPSDPKAQSENGKLLERVIINNDLALVNGKDLCKGAITRHRLTVNGLEESILDHFIVCNELFTMVTGMKVDEEESFALTKYPNKTGTNSVI